MARTCVQNEQPNKSLFGELVKTRPFHGTKQCYKDVNADLKSVNVILA